MFREMRRIKQQVSQEECEKILLEGKRGCLAVLGDDGYPYTFPMNFYYDKDSKRVYFHSALEGHKIDALKKCDKVSFTTWNEGYKEPGDWAWNVTSVICFGRAALIEDLTLREEMVRKIGVKYYPSAEEAEEVLRKHVAKVQLIALDIEHMTGKLVNES